MAKKIKKPKSKIIKCTHIEKCYDINTFASLASNNALLFNCKECQIPNKNTEIYICLACYFQGCLKHIQSHSITSDKSIHCLYITLKTHQFSADIVQVDVSENDISTVTTLTEHQISDSKHFLLYCINCNKKMSVPQTFESFIKILSPYINKDKLEEYISRTSNNDSVATCQMQVSEDHDRFYIPKGLQNLGNTCFFNSVIQVMCNTPAFIRALMLYNGRLNNFNDEDLCVDKYKDFPLITSAQQLFTSMNNSKSKKFKSNITVNPKGFLNALSQRYPFLEKGAQQDSHEFLLILLDALREEELKYNGLVSKYLAEHSDNSPSNASISISKVCRQSSPKLETFSFVNLIFGGHFVSNLTCQGCNHTSSTTEPFVDISLPVTTYATNGHPSKGVAKQSEKGLKNRDKGKKRGKVINKKNESDSDEAAMLKVDQTLSLNDDESKNSTPSANLSKHQLKKMKKKNKKILVAGKKQALKKNQKAAAIGNDTTNVQCCTDEIPSPISQLATRCTNSVLTSVLANLQCLTIAQSPTHPTDFTNSTSPQQLVQLESGDCNVEKEAEKSLGTMHLNFDPLKGKNDFCVLNAPVYVSSLETTPSSSGDSGILNTNESSSYTLDDIRSEGGKESDDRSLAMTQSEISEDEVDSAPKGSDNDSVHEEETGKIRQEFAELQLYDTKPTIPNPTLGPHINSINLNTISQQGLADILSLNLDNTCMKTNSSNIESCLGGEKQNDQTQTNIGNQETKKDGKSKTSSMLDSLFANFVRSEILVKTGLQCDGCKSKDTSFEKSIRIARAPIVLVVHFKRFVQQASASQKGCQLSKFSSAITFPEHFDLSPYLKFNDDDLHQVPCSYALYGVICHTGSLRSGHYYAYLRTSHDPSSPCWSYISDSSVRRNLNFSSISTSDAYLLFYERT